MHCILELRESVIDRFSLGTCCRQVIIRTLGLLLAIVYTFCRPSTVAIWPLWFFWTCQRPSTPSATQSFFSGYGQL